ncbi:hypothetical protein [uncultured Algibacter sp.]|uniref:hypothetical protein n=1 Tax=uncultured Algibacter sp. TaxID=298659 RepID=UPI003216998D
MTHTVKWNGLKLLGEITLERTFGIKDPSNSNDRLKSNISRTNYNISDTSNARGANSNYPFSMIGPR